jgi:hypothetical protein
VRFKSTNITGRRDEAAEIDDGEAYFFEDAPQLGAGIVARQICIIGLNL